jgi:hypothetical protein
MSNLIKKSFLLSMVVMTALWGVMGLVNVASANVATPGSLIKSSSSPAVYYLDANNVKHPFNHEREYYTWYSNFTGVVTVPTDEMVSYNLGATIVIRPGARLLQYVEVLGDGTWNVSNTPGVYAVGLNGALHHIDSAATAVAKYGSNWESMIVPIPNYLNGQYTNSDDLTSSSNYPTGTLVKLASASQVYYIDGTTKRPVTDAGFTANRFDLDYVITASSLSGYTDGTSITALDTAISNPVAGSGPVLGGSGLTVALASTSPGAQVAPISATNVPLMKFNLTASADGAVTVSALNVKRLGVGATADFAYLYLYDGATRLTNGKTLNSTTHIANFTNMGLSIAAGTTKTITLSADISTGTAGNVSYFEITSASSITSTAAITGSFPIYSNTTTIGSSAAGTLQVDTNGTLSNPSVGQQNATIAQFKLTAGSGEDLLIKRINLYEAGTLNNTYLTNLKLYQSTTLIGTVSSVTGTGYATFDLSASPYSLLKNTNRIFYVTADINTAARDTDTIKTYLDQTTDIFAEGATFGYGAAVFIGDTSTTDGTYDGTGTNYSTVTVQGGQITVAMNGPQTGTLTVGTTDAVLMNFSITSAIDAEIRSMRIELHKTSTDLDTDASTDCASGTDYISNVKVIDTANGESTSAINCGTFSEINGSNNGIYYTYTDYFDVTAGQTRNFAVKATLNASLTAGTYYAILGSSLTTFYTFSSTAIKNLENNQYVTDIVPTSYTQGNNQTVASAGLYVSLASNQANTNIVQGTSNVNLAEFAMQALTGSAITISGMTIYGYVDGDGAGATSTVIVRRSSVQEAGMSASAYVNVNNLVDNLRIYDKTADPTMTTNLNSTTESFQSTTGAATFSNMNWTIPAGTTHILAIVGNVSNSAFTNGDTGASGTVGMNKYIKVNFADNTAITAIDSSNNTVTMLDSAGGAYAIADGNGSATAITSSTYITVTSGGTLNVTAESNPAIANVVAGSSNVPMLNLKFQALNEAFNVNKFRITQSMGGSTRDVESVTISYPNQAGTTVTATQSLVASSTHTTIADADFNITNPTTCTTTSLSTCTALYVPAGNYKIVNVKFNLRSINQAAGAYTGDAVRATFVRGSTFEAKGAGSSSTSLSGTSNYVDVVGNSMIVHGANLTITPDTTAGNMSNGPIDMYKWQVTAAEGGTDVSLKKLTFRYSMTDSVRTSASLTLTNFTVLEGTSYAGAAQLTQGDNGTDHYQVYNGYGATGTVADGVGTGGKLSDASGKVLYEYATKAASSSHSAIIVFNDDRLISAGQSKYYILRTNGSNVDTGASSNDSISTYILDGDTATSTAGYNYAKVCIGTTVVGMRQSKYCLARVAAYLNTEEQSAYLIWSDGTGTTGNNTHTDIATVGATSSLDFFNGYKVTTLSAQRALN